MDRPDRPTDIMLTGDAARVLGVSEDSVRTFVAAGRLPAMRTTNGWLLLRRDDVEHLREVRAAARRLRIAAPLAGGDDAAA